MHGGVAEHVLAALVHVAIEGAHDAAVGLGLRRAHLLHLHLDMERVARPHRLQPAQFVHSRRAHAGGFQHAAVPDQAEAKSQRLEARGDEPAIDRGLGGGGVGVEGLRIIGQGEIDDLAFRNRSRTGGEFVARLEIVEIAIRHRRRQPSAATMAAPSSRVEALPPRSGVRGPDLSASTRAIAPSTAAAAAASPRCVSIIAAVQIWPMGLAMPFPAMSGAEPCTGSNIEGNSRSGLMLAPGAMPIEPTTAGPRSDKMSPNRFEPTTTSNQSGWRTKCAVRMSMWYWSVLTCG